MAPAFYSTRHAAVFGATILFLLVLPVTLHTIGGVSTEESYRGISDRAADFVRMRHEVFEDHSDLDVFFCGSSLLNSAINVKLLERQMTPAIGHPVKAVLLFQAWQGPDMQYFVARALLEQRR